MVGNNMKFGYSNLLGEYTPASELEHRDCEKFQIVCPQCREPLFKVLRDIEGSPTHYLSHYAAARAYASDCEMRVSSLPTGAIEAHDRSSRNQRLAHFLAVLREMIGKSDIYQNGYQRLHIALGKSKSIGFLREHCFKHMNDNMFSRSDFAEFAAGYISDITAAGGAMETSFAISIQERIAFDIWRHLLSGNAKPNFDFLFHHGYLALLSRIQAAASTRPLGRDEQMLHQSLARLMITNKQKGQEIIQNMLAMEVGPPFAQPGMTVLGKAMAEVHHEMIGTLLGLPYFEHIKAAAEDDHADRLA